jgi:hypothetical protein
MGRKQGNETGERGELMSANTKRMQQCNDLPLMVGWDISDIFAWEGMRRVKRGKLIDRFDEE